MFDGPIRDYARWTPRATAIATRQRVISYAEFDADIDRFGAAVAELGVTRGVGVVAIAIRASYLQLLALAALARLGIVSSPATDDAAELCLTDQVDVDGHRVRRLTADWTTRMFAAPAHPLPVLEFDEDAALRVMLSSGTTMRPRRIAFSRRRIEANSAANLRVYGAAKAGMWVPLTGVDSLLGFSVTVLGWSLGVTLVNHLDASGLPDLIETEPEGLVAMTPIQLKVLLADLPADARPQPGWRVAIGGSILPPALRREAVLRLTSDIRYVYGATESSQIAASRPGPLEDIPGLIGITPAGAILQVIGEDDHPLPDGQSGEIRVRGDRTALGYLDDPVATAQRFRDGWYYTNDIGRRLADGRLVVEGRVDDRMIVEGAKFMPAILEDAALACPGVRDAAAFAVPDRKGLDVCWLAVSVDADFDRALLAPHLARYPGLPPLRVAWIEEIPRNAMGKVERGKLRDAVIAVTGAQRD